MDRRIEEVLRHLHPTAGFKPWHGGPTALGALRGVSARVAAWRPYPDRHTIWELGLHVAYWNYAVERRLWDGPSGSFWGSPANWPRPGGAGDEQAWREDQRRIRESHLSLRDSIAGFDPGKLDEIAGSGSTTYADLITGVLLHDTYHAGQIQIMKRLARSHFGEG